MRMVWPGFSGCPAFVKRIAPCFSMIVHPQCPLHIPYGAAYMGGNIRMDSILHFFLPFWTDGKCLCLSTWLHTGQDDQDR